MRMSIYIIGAGVTGLSFASASGGGTVLERAPELGGRASSYHVQTSVGKFTFDIGGHWFHLQNAPKVMQLLEGLPLKKHARRAFVYWDEEWFDFPIQQSYRTHPDRRLVDQIEQELTTAEKEAAIRSHNYLNYSDMLLNSYGPTLLIISSEIIT